MEAVGIEQEASRLGCTERFRFMEQLHDAGPDGHRDSHDDTLADTYNAVFPRMHRSVKQMIRCLFERG